MDKPVSEGQFKEGVPPQSSADASDKTALPSAGAVSGLPTYAWWLVLGLVGLDCFSTLGYLPTLAVEGGVARGEPLAAVLIALLILFAALPVYLYVVGRSPHGSGVTGLLEQHVSGWGGKLLILLLLGFVATDFVITRTLSTADAAKHLIANDYAQSGVDWLLNRKDVLEDALPSSLQGEWTERFFDWWDGQLIVTVLLTVLGFALYFLLLRRFTRGFLYAAAVIVALFLLVNGIVIGSSLFYLAQHPEYVTNWSSILGFAARNQSPFDLFLDMGLMAVKSLPALALGFSGFELSMTVAPLVRGRPGDDPARPRGRIRNMRKLLLATAVLMSVFVPASVASVSFLVPPGTMSKGRPARDRALAYLAHGGALQPPGRRVDTGVQHEGDEDLPPPPTDAATQETTQGGAVLNPLFGPAFGALYDLSAVLILFLAGASVTISLRDFLPQYLTRYGMEMDWAHRLGALLHLFNVIVLVVVLVFHASVSHQQGAYATSVLVLLAAAALAARIDLGRRWRRSLLRDLAVLPLLLICALFLVLACWVCYESPAGLVIALLFVASLLLTAGFSRWKRSTELRHDGFAFADEESGIRWEQIRRLEFQVLVPHRPDDRTLAEKEAEIRARHRLAPDVPIIFVEAELGDPSNFQQHPLMQIVQQDGREVIRVSDCSSIAHVLAAIALDFREVGRPPEIHFDWSNESPLTSNLNFLLWGQGNVPWLVHALIRRAEPDRGRQPRVVIG